MVDCPRKRIVAQRLIALRTAIGLGPSEFADAVDIDRSRSFIRIVDPKDAARFARSRRRKFGTT